MDKNHLSQIDTHKNVKSFGLLPDGTEIACYALRNRNGCELSVINYGATITSLKIRVADKLVDVVLGFETLEDYINSYYLPSPPYFGTVVGRFSGRIRNGEFSLNGKPIYLNKNHGQHHLHGGILGFSKKVWTVSAISSTDNPSITLRYRSENNEENFPGTLTVEATYTLTEANELNVSFKATSSEDTVVNLTQHTYFNLDGHTNDITSQELLINSNKILETDSDLIPTGEFIPLANHTFDFSSNKTCPSSIDTTFILEGTHAATLFSKKNCLKMSVITDQPGVHVYVGGNCFHQIKGKENANYHTTSGICFETQNFPDAPNHSHFPTSILKNGEEYTHQTTFKFENI